MGSAFHDPRGFAFVDALESAFEQVLAELNALESTAFVPSPDSLTTVTDEYDETGWLYFDLHAGDQAAANRDRCPRTARALDAIPGLVNAGFSLLRPGTRLYPHRGELTGVLRCHLPLRVPSGDLGLDVQSEVRTWELGRCLVFDDTLEHLAWNRGAGDRVVLLVTFQP